MTHYSVNDEIQEIYVGRAMKEITTIESLSRRSPLNIPG